MTDQGRILGLDMGHVRIGVAVSDPMRIIAQPSGVVECASPARDAAAVAALVEQHEAVRIVVGLPLDQNGQVGPQARKVLDFIEQLRQAVEVEIVTQDERFTTVVAERSLIKAKVRRKKRKHLIDEVAAQQILQTHLDRCANERNRAQP